MVLVYLNLHLGDLLGAILENVPAPWSDLKTCNSLGDFSLQMDRDSYSSIASQMGEDIANWLGLETI